SYDLKVGIHCDGCVKKIKRILHKFDDNKKSSKMVLECSWRGSFVHQQSYDLKVGIHCDGCVKKIKRILYTRLMITKKSFKNWASTVKAV
ncbi:hypothetical protein BDA96_08G036200, partial [Sorghum bicolor]